MRTAAATLVLAGTVAAAGVGTGAFSLGFPRPTEEPRPAGLVEASPSADPVASAEASVTASPTAGASATPSPTPTANPTPVLVQAPLTGRLVTERVAKQHPIALMIDDAPAARPQSGFNAASVVWQAPAEGGVPRYLLIFQDQMPRDVGPVRSARTYFITWAAEWKAVYGHVGGSPQAMATLRAKGNGQLVYNADAFRWEGIYYRRIKIRHAPHNVYSDAKSLQVMATRVGAKNEPLKAAWRFATDAPMEARPSGGIIRVEYPYNTITYRYDRATNTYLRGVTGQPRQIDQADSRQVAPKNVIVMLMSFAPLRDGSNKHRLEADVVGSGKAWISTNGRTIVGTWRKTSLAGPTRFYDKAGKPVMLTVGQTFIQVMPLGSTVTVKDGVVPSPNPTPIAAPSGSPTATPGASSSAAPS